MSADTLHAEPVQWLDAWSTALDGFEMTLAEAEHLVATGRLIDSASESAALAWRPPTHLGPLPPALKDRATAILDRQLEIASRLAESARSTRQHMSVVATLRDRRASSPVYIDLVG